MRYRSWVGLPLIGLLAGCTTFVPVQHDGSGTWLEARKAPYQPGLSRFQADPSTPPPTQIASAGPVIYTGPIEPAPAADSFDPRPLPPLQGQATVWNEPSAEEWRAETQRFDPPAASAPPVMAAPPPAEPVIARAPEPAPAAAPTPPPAPRTSAPANVGDAARSGRDLAPPALSNVGFLWPADGEVRDGRSPGAPSHVANGLTIKARAGDPFVAAENGIVVFAGDAMESYGNMVVVRHDGDYTTAYGHAERLDVAVGDVVRRGQRLGIVGSTGAVDATQLYFEMRVGSQVVDPRHYLMGSPQQVASN
ncbi:MAG: M23 family metallopeptidase [Geminicoccaceae bacterium]|nr:MAG: M23 family metallopeptidase [Geminicoccaceae bacterium]